MAQGICEKIRAHLIKQRTEPGQEKQPGRKLWMLQILVICLDLSGESRLFGWERKKNPKKKCIAVHFLRQSVTLHLPYFSQSSD